MCVCVRVCVCVTSSLEEASTALRSEFSPCPMDSTLHFDKLSHIFYPSLYGLYCKSMCKYTLEQKKRESHLFLICERDRVKGSLELGQS